MHALRATTLFTGVKSNVLYIYIYINYSLFIFSQRRTNISQVHLQQTILTIQAIKNKKINIGSYKAGIKKKIK